jgi:hypothetical protein
MQNIEPVSTSKGKTKPENSNIEVILPNNLTETEKNAYKRYDSTFTAIPGYKEPRTLKQALSGPERSEWLKAVHIELREIIKKGTLRAIDSSKVKRLGRIPLSLRWIFKLKTDVTGKPVRYKARLVVRGFEQLYGLDYFETFASGAKPMTWRLLLALAAYYDWEIEHIDIVSAFLNGDLDEDIYIEPIEGLNEFLQQFPELNNFGWKFDDSQLLQLFKALYGLKQSPRQ